MKKTHYIKGKDGKFAGSIGAGKTNVPAQAPHSPATSPDVPSSLIFEVETPSHLSFYDVPDYCLNDYFTDDSESLTIPTKPSMEVLSTWGNPPSQVSMEVRINETLTAIEELQAINKMDNAHLALYELKKAHNWMSYRAGYFDHVAGKLREQGLHHQAYVAEWLMGISERANDHLFSSFSNLEDIDHLEEFHPEMKFDNTPWTSDRTDSMSAADQMDCLRNCGSHEFNIAALRADATKLSAGAVICDFLPTTAYDPEAAAVMSTFTENLWVGGFNE